MTAPLPFGPYEILRCLATGGMGEVLLARRAGPQGFQKLLVLKVLLPHLVTDPLVVQMFLDEARLASQLNHPNVAQVFDLGEAEGATYIAMEYVHGESLSRLMQADLLRGQKPPLPLVARMIADAAAGLDHAHHPTDPQGAPLGIVHRDVSPQNVMVTFEGGVKVIDFGIAKAMGRTVKTATGVLRGKVPYMSPEQAAGRPLDPRSDVFSLGIVLWELATGRRLFQAENELATMMRVARGEVPAPSALDPAVDAELERVILKALARAPAERFRTAGALQRELEHWLAGQSEEASSGQVGEYLRGLFPDRLAAGPRQDQEVHSALLARLARTGPRPGSRSRPSPAWALVPVGLLVAGSVGFALWPRAPAQAWLQVQSTPPGATVAVDGRVVGTTPLSRTELVPGRHAEVRVSLTGRESVVRTVLGEGAVALEVSLPPGKAPAKASTEAQVWEGQALLREGRWAEAAEVLEKALAEAPAHWEGQAALGSAYRELGRYYEASVALEKAAEGANDAESHLELARALALGGDTRGALRALEGAVQRGLSTRDLLVHPDLQSLVEERAFQDLARIAAVDLAPTPADASRRAGQEALLQRNLPLAARHFEAFLEMAPDYPRADWYRAVVARANAASRKPVPSSVAKSGSRQQRFRDAALAMGRALVKEKKYREAILPLEEAAKLGASEGHLYLGIAHAQLKDSARGAWHYEEFLHLDPGHPSAENARAILREFFARSPSRKPRYPL